ncbi:MAG: hypothetical protein O3B84_01680 [Chloroflexi bacterium]|nr:hypothetical protein [Chloroflexota bacterium]
MTDALLGTLALIGLGSAFILARGGRTGPQTANPWWFALSAANIILTLHVFGVLLPDTAAVGWVGVSIALVGFGLAGLRELNLWSNQILPRPGNREFLMEVVLIFTGVVTANVMAPLLPEVEQFTIIATVLIPLIMIRWASTRLKVPHEAQPEGSTRPARRRRRT